MKFYSTISSSYDYIFPYNPMHLSFVQKHCSVLKGSRILDIGCSTGALALKLAEQGVQVEAIDTDADMIALANDKKREEHKKLSFNVMDMLSIEEKFETKAFDSILCFGNTLVHLSNTDQVASFFKQVFEILDANGTFCFQILNYSHILKTKMANLPLINNDHVRFDRAYSYNNLPYIDFETKLKIKKTGEIIENSIPFLALELNDIILYLKEAGFKQISSFSNFKSDDYKQDTFSLVVKAKK